MVTVAEELPFVAVVMDDKLDRVCSNCFAVNGRFNPIDLIRCDNCRVMHYCSKKCQEEDWKFHEDECPCIIEFSKLDLIMEEVRMMSRIVMRVRRGDLPVAFNGRTFDDLMDHKDEIINDDSRKQHHLYGQLVSFMGRGNAPSFEEFLSLYGKRLINSFGIMSYELFDTTGYIGLALYLGIAAHNHSCRPAAATYFNGSKIVLWAHDPNAKYSKDLTISYVPITLIKETRQKQLRAKYYFDCDCERCMDEETALLELSGRSDCCPTEGAVLPVLKKSLWHWQKPLVCTNCGKTCSITLEQINTVNEKLAKTCKNGTAVLANVQTKEDVNDLMKTLDDAKIHLSPYNLNLLQFSNIVQSAYTSVYKDATMTGKYDLAEKKALEKYSLFKTMQNISHVITQLRVEVLDTYKNPNKEAIDKLDISFQKAIDVVKEAKGTQHPLYNEITQYSEACKNHYDTWIENYEEDKKVTVEEGADY